jgi:CDP-4-dehydro-6-deoxyglucose reductase, E1
VKGDNVPTADVLREQIGALVRQYYREQFATRTFNPKTDLVHYAGRVFDADELCLLIDASLDFFLTANRYADSFEADFADYLGVSNAILVNSGSSANLVALSALTSPKLGNRRLKPGDEVVTVAASFPTTLAPILQNNLVPVFVDVTLGDYTADPDQLRAAIGPKTRAIMMAHTMGVPFDLDVVADLAAKHDLWVVEDNCDALGSQGQSAIGVETATVPAARITPAECDSVSSSERCRVVSITSTSIAILAIT